MGRNGMRYVSVRVLTMLAITLSLTAFAPGGATTKPCECQDIASLEAEIQRVSTAQEAWKEIFAWAKGLHNDIAPPKSNDELNTKFLQLARAQRSTWDQVMHQSVQQIEKVQKAGGLDKDGEVIISPTFAETHCESIVEGVRVHERAHKDFYLSPGNFIEGGFFSSAHFKLRSESEVESYRAQKAFLERELKALKERCKPKRHPSSGGAYPPDDASQPQQHPSQPGDIRAKPLAQPRPLPTPRPITAKPLPTVPPTD